MKASAAQISLNRKSRKEAQLPMEPQRILSKSLIADFNSTTAEFQNSPEDSTEKAHSIWLFNSHKSPNPSDLDSDPAEFVTPLKISIDDPMFHLQNTPDSVVESSSSAVTFDHSVNTKQAESSVGVEEARMLVDFVRQVGNAGTVDAQSSKILDALLNAVMEKDTQYSQLVPIKIIIGSICFFVWLVLVWVLMFNNNSGSNDFFRGPLPT